MRRSTVPTVFTLVALFGAGAGARGQVGGEPADGSAGVETPNVTEPRLPPAEEAQGEASSRIGIRLSPRFEHTFKTDIDEGDGRIAASRLGADLDLFWPVSERLAFSLGVEGEYSWYGLDGTVAGLGDLDNLIDEAVRIDLVPRVQFALNERWTIIGAFIAEFAGEPGADVGDSATFGGYGAVRYAFSETFALTLGAGAKSRLEDDAFFIPLIGLEWRANQRITISSRGLGLTVTAKVTDDLRASIGAAYESRDYRLEDDNLLVPDGVFRDSRVPLRVGLEWSPNGRITVEGYGGVVLWHEYEVLDENGVERFESEADPAGFVGVRATVAF